MTIDDALAAWAASIHLPAETAADICQRIVATPAHRPTPGLDPGWWRRFATDFAARMVTSTQLPPLASWTG